MNDDLVKAHRQGYAQGKAAEETLRKAMADRIEELEAKLARAKGVLSWLDLKIDQHCTPTGRPARIKDESGVWHSGPAADICQKVLRVLQKLSRTTLAQIDAEPAEPRQPTVKPLVWGRAEKDGMNLQADCAFGRYYIALRAGHGWMWWRPASGPAHMGLEATEDQAKAAVQADYVRRVLSAIEYRQPTVQEAARVLLGDDFIDTPFLSALNPINNNADVSNSITRPRRRRQPMTWQIIEDHSQLKPGDLLEFRCPRFGLVTQWKVTGVHLGALHVESLIALEPITNKPAEGYDIVMVPEQMTRAMTIIRGTTNEN